MQIRQETALICKITSNYKNAAVLFNCYAQFLIHAYLMIGCTIYVEAIKGGAVVFYKTKEDFYKLQNFTAQLTPIEIFPPQPPATKHEIIKLRIEFVKKPDDMTLDELARVMQEAHQISPDISVKIKFPTTIILRYKSAGIFDLIFNKIRETLGNKMNHITPPLK